MLPAEGIMGTTDYVKYFCQAELNQYARNYAEEFNKKILQHLKKIGFRCKKNLVSSKLIFDFSPTK